MNLIKDEMRRKSIYKSMKIELMYLTEQERSRRISTMEDLLGSRTIYAKEMKETNTKLSQVHKDLKDAFQRREVRKNVRLHNCTTIDSQYHNSCLYST